MDRSVFHDFVDIIYRTSGIALNDKKESLVNARIAKRMRELGMADARDYLRHVTEDDSGEEIVQLLDVISTNVTHFFRESAHFDILSSLMQKWISSGQRRFRFWSAGCSSGEEPYTLAMILRESVNGSAPDIRILATDLSTRILKKSIAGVYDARKTEGIPPHLLNRYFERTGDRDEKSFSAGQELRSLITFKRLNLSTPPFPMQGPMDAIFCRNVMIYFDNTVRKNLLVEFHRLLKPGGYLFVGHAESLTGMLSGFKAVQPSVYVK